MRVRDHRGFSHGLRPGTDRDINCGSCIQEDATRKAIVGCVNGVPEPETVEKYLPSNYKITYYHDDAIGIEGVDNAGWTLDGYVIPRLASGLITCRED